MLLEIFHHSMESVYTKIILVANKKKVESLNDLYDLLTLCYRALSLVLGNMHLKFNPFFSSLQFVFLLTEVTKHACMS